MPTAWIPLTLTIHPISHHSWHVKKASSFYRADECKFLLSTCRSPLENITNGFVFSSPADPVLNWMVWEMAVKCLWHSAPRSCLKLQAASLHNSYLVFPSLQSFHKSPRGANIRLFYFIRFSYDHYLVYVDIAFSRWDIITKVHELI